jgi:hypothetical protein
MTRLSIGTNGAVTRKITNNASSMVTFERAKWYLENFYSVFTVPILLIGLKR